MLKKTLSILMVMVLLIFTVSGCGEASEGKISLKRNKTLTVCFDPTSEIAVDYLYDFTYTFKQVTGIENIEFEILPSTDVERETMIQRIRTEIMSGAGPDVFLVQCGSADYALFPYPEKVMENGMFLPLDDYMENKTEYTDWDKQQPVVLAAGRNEEGQQIIPLSYTAPVQYHAMSKLDMEKPDHPLTFDEALADPEWSAVYTDFYDCRSIFYDSLSREYVSAYNTPYLKYFLGKWADFESEELLFTEEELLTTVQKILSLYEEKPLEDPGYEETNLMTSIKQLAEPSTMVPLYSIDGGITVQVGTFAAINRNTRMPDEAYCFLDYFMRQKMQADSYVHYGFFAFTGIPMDTEVFSEEVPLNRFEYLPDETFAELTDFRDQITDVNFGCSLEEDLYLLMSECLFMNTEDAPIEVEDTPIEDLVHDAYEQMQRKVRE